MSAGDLKRCTVVYATADRQYLWELELPQAATVADALESARAEAARGGAHASGASATDTTLVGTSMAGALEIPWNTAAVGIFGELVPRTAVPREGDRIEIYRPLAHDPRELRRRRVREGRRVK